MRKKGCQNLFPYEKGFWAFVLENVNRGRSPGGPGGRRHAKGHDGTRRKREKKPILFLSKEKHSPCVQMFGARFQARISPGRGEGARSAEEGGRHCTCQINRSMPGLRNPAKGGAEKKLRGIEQKGRGEAQFERTGPQESR